MATLTITVFGTNDGPVVSPDKTVWVPDSNDSLAIFDPVELQGYQLMIAPATDIDGDTLTYDVTAVNEDSQPNNSGNEYELPFFSGSPDDGTDVSLFDTGQEGEALQGSENILMLVRSDHDIPFDTSGANDHFGNAPGSELDVYLAVDLNGDGAGSETEQIGNQQDLNTYDALFQVADAETAVEANAGATVTQGVDGLLGLAGDDTVEGTGGADLLFGYEGNNELTGNAGNDTFVIGFNDGGVDTITDFDDGNDVIGLIDLEFSDLTLVENGGDTEIYANGVLLAVVLGVVGLTSADFDSNVDPFWFDTGDRTSQGSGDLLAEGVDGEIVWGLYADGDNVFQIDTTTGDVLTVAAGTSGDANNDTFISLNEYLAFNGGLDGTDLWEFILDDSTGGNQQGRFAAVEVTESGATGSGDGGLIVTGSAGIDLIFGSTEGDDLSGLAGDDVIFGDGGSDTINGGAGDDVLDGGAGIDSFVYDGDSDTLNDIDTILNFNDAEDTFDFSFFTNDVDLFADVTFSTSGDGDIVVEISGESAAELDGTFGMNATIDGTSTADEVALTIV